MHDMADRRFEFSGGHAHVVGVVAAGRVAVYGIYLLSLHHFKEVRSRFQALYVGLMVAHMW